MPMPDNQPIIDTMIGFPHVDFSQYDFIRKQTKDKATKEEFDFPVEYMFKNVPKELYGADDDPVEITLGEMNRFNVQKGLIGCEDELSQRALREHPERFIPCCGIDPNDIMGEVRKLDQLHKEFGLKAASAFPAGCIPQCPIDDRKFYPIYAKCCELDIPIFVCAGVPGPRFPFSPQHVERIDNVMYDFPELTFVTRHGCEPWEELAVKLMLKWPGLYYSTSAFAPKYYPKAIIDYANTRGADRVIYAGYFPMGLSLERIMSDMQNVPLKEEVWSKFLYQNAARVLKID